MNNKEDQKYLNKVLEIRDKVYEFYNLSGRKDLVMVYEMKQQKIYSYLYEEYKNSLHKTSREILEMQYKEAMELGQIVLFLKDDEKKVV